MLINIGNNLNWNLNEPAKESDIVNVEHELNVELPNQYKELLYVTDGFSTDESITIFGTGDIVERNKTYEVEKYARGYVAIGNDGGDDFLLMKANSETKEVISVGCGVMDPKYSHHFTDELLKWINEGAMEIENFEEEDEEELCKLILIKPPQNGARDLRKIEEAFDITYRAFEILKGYRNVPFVLADNIGMYGALDKIKSLGDLGKLLKIEKL